MISSTVQYWTHSSFFPLFFTRKFLICRAETIIEWPFFPFVIPGPRKAVAHTLRNFKTAITLDEDNNPADLLMAILKRSEQVSENQTDIVQKRMRRSMRQKIEIPTPIVNAIRNTAADDVDEESHVIEFQDATNDVESATNSTNYGTMA